MNHIYDVSMLDFLKSLSELSSWQSLPWRWWVSFALGIGGMIAILTHVESDIAVLYVFLDLILCVVVGAAWQWNADSRARQRHRGR